MPDKKKMFVLLILDESSSMGSCRDQTISGLNEYIDSQKGIEEVDVFLSLTKFNTKCTPVFIARPIEHVEHMSYDSYRPDGMTALYDAIGQTVTSTEDALRREPDHNVLVVINTDGADNSSREYNLEKIRELIRQKEAVGWTFVFLGTDINAWAAGSQLGVHSANAVQYSRGNTAALYSAVAASTRIRARHVSEGADRSVMQDFTAGNIQDYAGLNATDQDANDVQANVQVPRKLNLPPNES